MYKGRGFTLVEMVVVLLVLSILLGVIMFSFFALQHNSSIQTQKMLLDGQVISFTNLLEKEFRMLGFSPIDNAGFGIVYGDNDSILYTTDNDGDGLVDPNEIRAFYLNNDTVFYYNGTDQMGVLMDVDSLTFIFVDTSGSTLSCPIQEVDIMGNVVNGHVVKMVYYSIVASTKYGKNTIETRKSGTIGFKNR